jgi:hypothetical protein
LEKFFTIGLYIYIEQLLQYMDIFSIFQQDDSQVFQEYRMHKLLDDSYTNLGRVITSVENYLLLDQIYSKKYPQKYQEVRDSIKQSYFLKVTTLLESINIEQEGFISDFLTVFAFPRISNSLTYLLEHFQGIEYYEKCATIKKILDKFIEKKFDPYR